jgi:hypothetical protein
MNTNRDRNKQNTAQNGSNDAFHKVRDFWAFTEQKYCSKRQIQRQYRYDYGVSYFHVLV